MNPQLATLSDLRDWANRNESRSQLPILLRKLILASTDADRMRAPGGDAVGEDGWDIILDSPTAVLMFVPAGESRWEGGVGADPRGKAQSDFKKRTDKTTPAERAEQTFVFFTPREFGAGDDWVKGKKAEANGWFDIRVIDATVLMQWLEQQPAVHIWLSELIGNLPTEVRPLETWWTRWSGATTPAMPPGVLTAGRASRAEELRTSLRSAALVQQIVADTTDEVLAFVAASLQDEPSSAAVPTGEDALDAEVDSRAQPVNASPDITVASGTAAPGGAAQDAAAVELLPTRPALLGRVVIVDSANAWARLEHGTTPLVLVPTFADPDVQTAAGAGHHVIVPDDTRRHDHPLPRIRVDEAADALRVAGVEFGRAHEYATAARRSLSGLRRRLANSGQLRLPEWATGTAPETLGPLLLLGGWDEDHPADIELLEDLTETKWRKLARSLQTVTRMQDPPVRVDAKKWEFLDPIDAWDLMADAVTSLDLETFHERVVEVLTESDPVLALPVEEQPTAGMRGIRRKYSQTIREGMATTLAVLGAVVGDRQMQDGLTGQQNATIAVRALLASDDPAHWINLAQFLPTLAEAAPDAFLEATERAVAAGGEPLKALFDEGPASPFGRRGSSHHHLLWALDRLTFSDRYVSRALLVLAQLGQQDPDPAGRSLNRPLASIVSALHLIRPQSAVTSASRGKILELIETRFPDIGSDVMIRLVEGTAGGTIFTTSGPRWRDWTLPQAPRTIGHVYADVVDVLDRLITGLQQRPSRAKELVALVPDPAPRERRSLLDAIVSAATTLDAAERRAVAEKLAELTERYQPAPADAAWALPVEDVEAITQAATTLAPDILEIPPVEWFSHWPRRADTADPDIDIDELIDKNRASTIRDVYEQSGLDGVAELARQSEAAGVVGQYLARHTSASDSDVFTLGPLIDDIESKITQVVLGYADAKFRERGIEWLTTALDLADEPVQPVLFRASPATTEVLRLLDDAPEAVQDGYWRHPLHGGIPKDSVRDYARRLLQRGLAWSALVVIIIYARQRSERLPEDADLELRVLEAVRTTTEDPREFIGHHAYGLGQLLDQLAAVGLDQTRLAQIEYYFLPLLEHSRHPAALYGEFVRNPELFASVVIGTFRPETDEDTDADSPVEAHVGDAVPADATDSADEPAADGGGGADTPADPAGLDSLDLLDDATARALFGTHGWQLLREWEGLPGQTSKHEVDPDVLKTWVISVMAILEEHDRAQSGRHQIGQMLSSPITDADGTWPCRAVRDLLEELHDQEVESGLLIGRFNQRGVTVRSPYDGGEQERTLAQKYRAQADALRDTWPRTGVLLDDLAKGYEADGRREDRNVDR